jgi:hypothetical protein
VNSAAERAEAQHEFGDRIRIEDIKDGVNAIVARHRTLGQSLIQLKPGADELKNEEAYLDAELLANGGYFVVVGTNQTVNKARQIPVIIMLQAAEEATQAIGRSA